MREGYAATLEQAERDFDNDKLSEKLNAELQHFIGLIGQEGCEQLALTTLQQSRELVRMLLHLSAHVTSLSLQDLGDYVSEYASRAHKDLVSALDAIKKQLRLECPIFQELTVPVNALLTHLQTRKTTPTTTALIKTLHIVSESSVLSAFGDGVYQRQCIQAQQTLVNYLTWALLKHLREVDQVLKDYQRRRHELMDTVKQHIINMAARNADAASDPLSQRRFATVATSLHRYTAHTDLFGPMCGSIKLTACSRLGKEPAPSCS